MSTVFGEAVQHLVALGHVDIAFVSGPLHVQTAAKRQEAFQMCMNEVGLEMRPDLLFQGDHTMEAGMKAMSALASLRTPPSAVVCSNDLTAIGVMRQAFELALAVPRDLSVVGFDDIRLAEFMIPPLTTVQMSQTEIAETAFMALLECLNGDCTRPSQATIIKTRLVLRRSTTLATHRRMKTGNGMDEPAPNDQSRERPKSPLVLT
jgi:DNA-binding LacI/PurR family transcriptional regulator